MIKIDEKICYIKMLYVNEIKNIFEERLEPVGWGKTAKESNSTIKDLLNYLDVKINGILDNNQETPWLLDLLDYDGDIIDTIGLSEEQALYINKLKVKYNIRGKILDWRMHRNFKKH